MVQNRDNVIYSKWKQKRRYINFKNLKKKPNSSGLVLWVNDPGHWPELGLWPVRVMTKKKFGAWPKKINRVMTVTQVVIKFLNTNYKF